MNQIVKFNPEDAGCLIDGHWGQYGVARMVQIANSHGYEGWSVVSLADQKLLSMSPSEHEPLSDTQEEFLSGAADEVEMWMNENLAPEGYSFYWEDGEFGLWSNDYGIYGLDDADDDYVPQTDGWNSYPEDLDTSDAYDKEYDVP